MDAELCLLLGFTFVVNLVGALAYSVRIAGIRTLRIAVSLSLFNVLVLLSRLASTFATPLLTSRVETSLSAGRDPIIAEFRWLLAAASLGTIAGALLTPTFQRVFTKAVQSFAVHRSFARLLLRAATPTGLSSLKDALTPARPAHLHALTTTPPVPARILVANVAATALWTVGAFAPILATVLHPALRATIVQLSGVINGGATILLFLLVDPHLSLLTDDVLCAKRTEASFRRAVVWMLGTRLMGTALAQAILLPAAILVTDVAQRMATHPGPHM